MTTDEDDAERRPLLLQVLEDVEPREPGQAQVEDQAARGPAIVRLREFGSGRERGGLVARHTQEALNAVSYGIVIVEDENR
jgi:hypothetical protein